MDRLKLSQLTKEMVAMRLKELGDPCVAATEVSKKTLWVLLQDVRKLEDTQREAVVDICQGTMTGLLLAEQNLAKGAVELLKRVCELASQLNLDQTELMRLALKGIADMQRFVDTDAIAEIGNAIQAEFMDTGRVFTSFLEEGAARKAEIMKSPHPKLPPKF